MPSTIWACRGRGRSARSGLRPPLAPLQQDLGRTPPGRPTGSRAWPCCATPMWPCSRTPARWPSRPFNRRQLVDAPVPPVPVLVGVFDCRGHSPPGDRGRSHGILPSRHSPATATAVSTWSPGPSWPRRRRRGSAGHGGCWSAPAAGTVDRLPGPGRHGDGYRRRRNRVHPLDLRWNTPTHDPARLPAISAPRPSSTTTKSGRRDREHPIDRDPDDRLPDRAGERGDGRSVGTGLPNATFWQWRYLTDPDLGSGVGSQGRAAPEQAATPRRRSSMPSAPHRCSTWAVETARRRGSSPMPGYTGIDLSDRRRCRRAGPAARTASTWWAAGRPPRSLPTSPSVSTS